MINCVIVEDESLAQQGLLKLIKQCPALTVLSVCDDIEEFLTFQKKHSDPDIDLLFLDIELPGINGVSFLRNTQLQIPVILTTAYHHYAIEGFELNVLDYLLKPISIERFNQAISKAENYIHFTKTVNSDQSPFIYLRSEGIIEKVYFNEIILIEAMRNYVIYHCDKRKLICYTTLKNSEQNLPPEQFIKIQKSFIVNKYKVEKIDKGCVYILSKNIPIAREGRNESIKRLTNL